MEALTMGAGQSVLLPLKSHASRKAVLHITYHNRAGNPYFVASLFPPKIIQSLVFAYAKPDEVRLEKTWRIDCWQLWLAGACFWVNDQEALQLQAKFEIYGLRVKTLDPDPDLLPPAAA